MHEGSPVNIKSDRVLGAIVGVICAMVIVAAIAIVVATEIDLAIPTIDVWSRRDHEPTIWILLICGLPVGVLFGSLIGSLAPVAACSRRARVQIYTAIAVPSLVLCLPYWPALALFAIPLTLFHAALVARNPEPPPAIPAAIVRRRR